MLEGIHFSMEIVTDVQLQGDVMSKECIFLI